MIHTAKLPSNIWAEAVRTAVYILNRLPSNAIDVSPYEAVVGTAPSLHHIRIFGSKAWEINPDPKRTKWDPKPREMILVGYSNDMDAYRLMDDTGRVVTAIHVTIVERKIEQLAEPGFGRPLDLYDPATGQYYPQHRMDMRAAQRDASSTRQIPEAGIPHLTGRQRVLTGDTQSQFETQAAGPSHLSGRLAVQTGDRDRSVVTGMPHLDTRSEEDSVSFEMVALNEPGPAPESESDDETVINDEVPLNINSDDDEDEHHEEAQVPLVPVPPVRETRSRLDLTRHKFVDFTSADFEVQADANAAEFMVPVSDDPLTVQEALASNEKNQWEAAMKKEMDSLKEQGTWVLVKRPDNRSIIKNKWVFKTKRKADGSIERYKARLVAKGYTQRLGIDYEEVFAPVMRSDTLRCLLAIVQKHKLHMKQLDVVGAYLYGEIEEDLYMEEPESFATSKSGEMVCKLQKSLYGLKQSARKWNEKFTVALKGLGLNQSVADPCLYVNKTATLFCAIYVDDCLLAAADESQLSLVINQLQRLFKVTVGDSTFFVGMQIEKHDGHLLVHQEAYTKRILRQFNMENCHPISTPGDSSAKLHKPEQDAGASKQFPYRELIGSLMYLAVWSRPDIAYITSVLSQYLENPDETHWNAGKRVLRYLAGTPKVGIKFGKGSDILIGYSDADYAGDIDNRLSRSGIIFVLNGGPVSWTSQKQSTISTSTCQAEYVAAFEATKSAVWLRRLMHDLGVKVDKPTPLMVDNQGTIHTIKNPASSHKRSKHWDIQYHYVQEQFKAGTIHAEYVCTKKQLADFLTKSLTPDKFSHNLSQLNMI
jgi:hypothetical protein